MSSDIGPILGAVAAELRDRQQQPRSKGLRTLDGARLALAAVQDETVDALAVLRDVTRCDCAHHGCGHPKVSSVAFAMIGVAVAALHGVQGIHAALGIDTMPADQSDPIVEAEALRHRWIVAGVDRANLTFAIQRALGDLPADAEEVDQPYDPETLAARMIAVAEMLTCPVCGGAEGAASDDCPCNGNGVLDITAVISAGLAALGHPHPGTR